MCRTYFSSYIFTYRILCQRRFGYIHNFWLLKNPINFFQNFSPKKKRHFLYDNNKLNWSFFIFLNPNFHLMIIFNSFFLPYNQFCFIFSFSISFLSRVIYIIKTFDPQHPLTLWNNNMKFFDPQEPFQDLYIFLDTDGSTMYCALYQAKRRRDHQLSTSQIVMWSCDLEALLQKLLSQRLIGFGHLVPIENNL